MTQEELETMLKDQEAEELNTLTQGAEQVADAIDKAYTDVDSKLTQGQALMQNAQNAQTQYTIDEIERQKAQTQKDYEKEQKAAYVDYQNQINPYGANAEKMVSAGLDNSGYAESSKVAMYNEHQNRVAVARESMDRAIGEYNASIASARAQNSVAMAQIAYDTLMKKMEYTTTHMLKKAELLSQLVGDKLQVQQRANDKWLSVLDSMSEENSADLPIDTTIPKDQLFTNADKEFDSNRTYNNVKAYLQDKGFSADIVAGLMTREQWRENKDKLKKKYDVKTYKQYLDAYMAEQEEVWDEYIAYLKGEEE